MADFEFTVDGVTIPVRGANSEDEALQALQSAIRNDKDFVENQRRLQVSETGGSPAEAAAVGFVAPLVGLGQIAQAEARDLFGDEEGAQEVRNRFLREQEAIQALDDRGFGFEDTVDVAGLAGGGIAGARMLFNLGKNFFKMRAGQVKNLVRNVQKTPAGDQPISVVVNNIMNNPQAARAMKVMGDINDPKVAEKVLREALQAADRVVQ